MVSTRQVELFLVYVQDFINDDDVRLLSLRLQGVYGLGARASEAHCARRCPGLGGCGSWGGWVGGRTFRRRRRCGSSTKTLSSIVNATRIYALSTPTALQIDLLETTITTPIPITTSTTPPLVSNLSSLGADATPPSVRADAYAVLP